MAEDIRTVMYSVEDIYVRKNGEKVLEKQVVVHKFPWDRNNKYGMQKLQRMVERGFTFEDPRVGGATQNLEYDVKETAFCKECADDGREVLKTDCKFHEG